MKLVEKSDLEKKQDVLQFKTDKLFSLKPISLIPPSLNRYNEIFGSCSKDPIYKWLFTKRFPNGYSLEDAKEFFLWAKQGWEQGTHFVYLLSDLDGSIVGSIDIRSNNLELAETGYWVNAKHGGLATNALAKIAEIAKKAGYKALFAQVEAANDRSLKVLERNGFTRDDSLKTNENCDQAYIKHL